MATERPIVATTLIRGDESRRWRKRSAYSTTPKAGDAIPMATMAAGRIAQLSWVWR